eukprot:GHVU01072758.1.p1 GENE.GHVU01072758.1~~GHVU01072758.1.p1  ORF type:complete len:135 (-),score=31.28 GHVU01072758.1:559-963(-)
MDGDKRGGRGSGCCKQASSCLGSRNQEEDEEGGLPSSGTETEDDGGGGICDSRVKGGAGGEHKRNEKGGNKSKKGDAKYSPSSPNANNRTRARSRFVFRDFDDFSTRFRYKNERYGRAAVDTAEQELFIYLVSE